jgi:hypothetical protein
VSKSKARFTEAHRIFLWPAIQKLIAKADPTIAHDFQHIQEEGTAWFVQREMKKHPKGLAPDFSLSLSRNHAIEMSGRRPEGVLPGLTTDLMIKYTEHYFNTYNMVYPVLDYDDFIQKVLPTALKGGFDDESTNATIALLVFTLGQVALEGVMGQPISKDNGIASGIRGGSATSPPGLQIFTEARRRLGFVFTECQLETAQVLLLVAYVQRVAFRFSYTKNRPSIYFETTGRHLVSH